MGGRARELVDGLRAVRWASEQLVTGLLAAIRALDTDTHAVASCCEDEALAEAHAFVRRRAAGEQLGAPQERAPACGDRRSATLGWADSGDRRGVILPIGSANLAACQ